MLSMKLYVELIRYVVLLTNPEAASIIPTPADKLAINGLHVQR